MPSAEYPASGVYHRAPENRRGFGGLLGGLRLIDHQRVAYMRQLSLLGVQRRRLRDAQADAFVTNLLIDGAELAVRAELTWLDDVALRLKERFSNAS